ncbi:Mediator of RNA polymerase II transcription subunit 7 [Cyphomyrmex costatus]|uniref:Mediator of RNA polymerase II transcription subunit 7 n=1 Tax=Cyphomyrmex costatus TaxID=456900 RepID=A0A195CKD1_9HYME|nr:Mediator of RNA polymerase II transcription subunit 7 [Cyphomyrmex costatus]
MRRSQALTCLIRVAIITNDTVIGNDPGAAEATRRSDRERTTRTLPRVVYRARLKCEFEFSESRLLPCDERVEDLSLLFIHIHHLLNEFRPHQARETLRVMMELQRRQRHETALRFQKHLDKVQEILQHALQMLPDTSELDSKLAINTDAIESIDNLGFEQQTQDPCSSSDRIMCKVIDDMLSSNGLF